MDIAVLVYNALLVSIYWLTNLKETIGIQRIRKITLLKKIISEIEQNCRLQYILVKKIISEIKNLSLTVYFWGNIICDELEFVSRYRGPQHSIG